ncbi:MAG TPA: hypothetical protein VFI31_11715 [Pirellulales bacterium]|nr:hypothetical protein [Pirellulales bacterium]
MRRPQFTLRALLVALFVVAAFVGGMAVQRQLDKPQRVPLGYGDAESIKAIRLGDGTTWIRYETGETEQ